MNEHDAWKQVEYLIGQSARSNDATDAMKWSQAALNAAHAISLHTHAQPPADDKPE